MTIKISIAPEYREAELGEYGAFKIRPLGAGEELQISLYSRTLGELSERAEALAPKGDKKTEEEEAAALDEVRGILLQVEELREKITTIVKAQVIGASSKKQVDRLFNELPLVAIRNAINEVLNG